MLGAAVLVCRILALGVWLRSAAAGPRALLLDEFRQQLHETWQPGASGTCDAAFALMQDYIIRTRDSLSAGAAFLRAPAGVSSPEQCLRACCSLPGCTAAVVERASPGGGGGGGGVVIPTWEREQKARPRGSANLSCYLFNCTHRGRDVCRFSPHRGYSSFSRPLNGSRRSEPHRHSNRHDEAPHCDAGQDVNLLLPTDWVLLDGRGSSDDWGIVRYEWTLLQGDPLVNMKSPQPGTLKMSGLQEGEYVIQLSVTDSIGQKSNDNVTVTVMPPKQQTTDCTGVCSRYQFICDDGCCIDITLACDGIAQCPDKSDETFCHDFNIGRKTVTHTTLAAASEQDGTAWPFGDSLQKDSIKSQKPMEHLESEMTQSSQAEGRGKPSTGRLPENGTPETSSAETNKDDVMIHHRKGGHPLPETGAVLPLALGLAITALLLLMIICRLQLVKRKLKKVRPITSEESDYLINGMYL
ncbi:low-density lipoprotein receptor-related protein 11 isoform X2 [Hypanus sabinus]|uniref:low-density lipoprotein receptor-related protein 11 isoform X2 n=1 Tax=Hypanus sabinus TaxID=79690 RepID=UPI0028C4FC82|nr:low-density lipoprotein receptor-related protein 11 isoform X2 [Hypanus sabinus]